MASEDTCSYCGGNHWSPDCKKKAKDVKRGPGGRILCPMCKTEEGVHGGCDCGFLKAVGVNSMVTVEQLSDVHNYIPAGYKLQRWSRSITKGQIYLSPITCLPKEADVDFKSYTYLAILEECPWVWPEWLKAGFICQEPEGFWFAVDKRPLRTSGGWYVEGDRPTRLTGPRALVSFTPPPCNNWETSLRCNPNVTKQAST